MAEVSALEDPCPGASSQDKADQEKGISLKKKKDNLLYAPMANVGRVTMDKDGLYIELKNVNYTKSENLHVADGGSAMGLSAGGTDTVTPVDLLRRLQVR